MADITALPFWAHSEYHHSIDLPFPPLSELDRLLNQLQGAIAREETLAAVDIMLDLRTRLAQEHAEAFARLASRESDWTHEHERLCDRMHRMYAALARAGTSTVEDLASWYKGEEPLLTLGRDVTLEWFAEASKWERQHDLIASWLVLSAPQRLCA